MIKTVVESSGCKCCCHSHSHSQVHSPEIGHTHGHPANRWLSRALEFMAPAISFIMLAIGMILDHIGFSLFISNPEIKLLWYVLSYLPVGIPVLKEAWEGMMKKDYFSEFTLMSLASIGAFCIGEYPEAVGVMLFYCIGEKLQDIAVGKATRDISGLIARKADVAHLIENGKPKDVDPRDIEIGSIIDVYPGERLPLDGILMSEAALFDTSALTGESVPKEVFKGGEALSGMISLQTSARIRITRGYSKSTLSRIMEMVRDASERKAPTELFVRKFARIYTPAVLILAILVVIVPAIIGLFNTNFHYEFSSWLNRALVFLVISCPCALVISIPLGYFAGIGVASRNGILFKGGNYLDAITKVSAVAFDKTGTLTTGKFSVDKIRTSGISEEEFIALLASAETASSHPLAMTLREYAERTGIKLSAPSSLQEFPGFGTEANVDGKTVLAGNLRLMEKMNVEIPEEANNIINTAVFCAVDGHFCGWAEFSDTLKADSETAVRNLKSLGVTNIVMLSGDKQEITSRLASRLGITKAYGNLLPTEKAKYVEKISSETDGSVAFVGDGMNDSPVLAVSDVGIAMGALGSDMAVEAADIVIQNDSPSKVASAIKIGRYAQHIIKENIVMAIGIKVAILCLGFFGIASLWGAVFADVGVALLAVLNAMRILKTPAN